MMMELAQVLAVPMESTRGSSLKSSAANLQSREVQPDQTSSPRRCGGAATSGLPETLMLGNAEAGDELRHYNIESEYDSDWTSAVQPCLKGTKANATKPHQASTGGGEQGGAARSQDGDEAVNLRRRRPRRKGLNDVKELTTRSVHHSTSSIAHDAKADPGCRMPAANGEGAGVKQRDLEGEEDDEEWEARFLEWEAELNRKGLADEQQGVGICQGAGGSTPSRGEKGRERRAKAGRPKAATTSRRHCSGSLEAPSGSCSLDGRGLIQAAGAAATGAGSFVLLVRPPPDNVAQPEKDIGTMAHNHNMTTSRMALRRVDHWQVT